MARAFGSLDSERQAQLKADLVALWCANNRGEGRAPLSTRNTSRSSPFAVTAILISRSFDSIPRQDNKTSRRAELLADRIEEGAPASPTSLAASPSRSGPPL